MMFFLLLLSLSSLLLFSSSSSSFSSPSSPNPSPSRHSSSSYTDFLNQRTSFLSQQSHLSINAAWELTPEEKKVDQLLSSLKDIDYSLDPIPIQFNFVSMKPTIDQSKLLSFLKSFPKGALLHSHDTSSQDMHFYVDMSYLPGCLYSLNEEDYGSISFLPTKNYVPISEVRMNWPGGSAKFDEELYANFTISQSADQPHSTGDDMWAVFEPIFSRLHMAYQYLPIFRQFFRLMYTKLFNDGLIRWEMRTSVPPVYNEDGEFLTEEATLEIILEELENWKAEDPSTRSIFSIGIIMQGIRSGTVSEVTESLHLAYALRDSYPDILIGFDLVGQEDPGKTLLYWAPILLNITESMPSPPMPFYFHSGESNRLDVQVNLVDAIFLNTQRIGHGFGVPEFPALWPLISRNGVLIESNPISNQVLGLVVDQRNHPIGDMLRHALHNVFLNHHLNEEEDSNGSEINQYSSYWSDLLSNHPKLAHYIKNRVGIPSLAVSISNDDPGFWDIDAIVSYDWYVAVLAWELSLGGIKQMALDSILHSGVSIQMKGRMLIHWFESWDRWIEQINQEYSL